MDFFDIRGINHKVLFFIEGKIKVKKYVISSLAGLFLGASAALATPVVFANETGSSFEKIKAFPDPVKRTMMFDYINLNMNDAVFDMIDKAGFDPNMTDVNGMTGLMIAGARGNTNLALGLIARGADKTLRDDVKKLTAEEWAENTGHLTTAMMIKMFEKSMITDAPSP